MTVLLWVTKIERKKDVSGGLLPLDVDGFVDHGVMLLVDSSYTSDLMLLGNSTDVRSPWCEISLRFPEAPALLEQART
jgi:hypothetical protein